MVKLRRYTRLLDPQDLVSELSGEGSVEKVDLDYPVDLSQLDNAVESVLQKKTIRKSSDIDIDLTRAVYETFRHLPNEIAHDMRFWQWLTVGRYRKLVAKRWIDKDLPYSTDKDLPYSTEELDELIGDAPAKRARFLGSNSLAGYARNTLSRLFFAGKTLYSSKNQYKLVNAVFVNQDRQQAIFERNYCLLENVAKALAAVSLNGDGDHIKKRAKRLNHVATTIDLGLLSEIEIKSLLS